MVFQVLCNRQSSFTARGYRKKNVHLFTVHDPSHTNDAMKNFGSQPCPMFKKNKKKQQPKNTQMLSNSSIHLEAIQRYHAKFG